MKEAPLSQAVVNHRLLQPGRCLLISVLMRVRGHLRVGCDHMLFQLREKYFTSGSGVRRLSPSIYEDGYNAIKPIISASSWGFSYRANGERTKDAQRNKKHETFKLQQLRTTVTQRKTDSRWEKQHKRCIFLPTKCLF